MTASSDVSALPKRWVLTARFAWLLITLTLLSFFIGGLPLHYGQLIQTCSEASCPVILLHPAEAEILNEAGLTLHNYAVFHLVVETLNMLFWLSLAIIIFWKKFANNVGVALSFLLVLGALYALSLSSQGFVEAYVPWNRLLEDLPGLPVILFILTFPNGRFVPNWTKYILLVSLILTLNPIPMSEEFENLYSIVFGDLAFVVMILIGLSSQIYRYRFVSNSVQKRQTKLALYGLAAFLFGIINWIFFFEIFRPEPGQTRLILYTFYYAFLYILFLFFPTSLVIAIMRHRLFDIDVLIRRTLIYGLLSASLAIIYFGTIILSQNLFHRLTGQESQLIIVLSTLAIAALFTPLRKGIQNVIDRRFYRRKYDTEKVLAEFALKARDEVELDTLTQELTRVVKETMQPAHLALWLKKDNG